MFIMEKGEKLTVHVQTDYRQYNLNVGFIGILTYRFVVLFVDIPLTCDNIISDDEPNPRSKVYSIDPQPIGGVSAFRVRAKEKQIFKCGV